MLSGGATMELPGFLRRLLGMALAFALIVTATASIAADYDPFQCPDARATAADMIAAVASDAPELLTTGGLAVDIACALCCQPPPSAAAADQTVDDRAYAVVRFPRSAADSLTATFEEILRPPRR